MPVRFVLDCDTGSDDAVAILAAAGHTGLAPIAVTCVNGNVPLADTTANTLRALDHAGLRVPVYAGAARPLVRPDFPTPRAVLNEGSAFQSAALDLPDPVSAPEEGSAVTFLVDTFMADSGADVTLVATGPLTNLALALGSEPRLAERIPRLVLMGGAHGNGNVTAAAEFNFWADPEAAAAVLSAGIRDVVIFPLDATHSAPLSLADCERLAAAGTPAALAAADLIRHRIRHGRATDATGMSAPVHDPMCVAYLVRPDIVAEGVEAFVSVETAGAETLGELLVDTRPWRPGPPNATVALRASPEVYREFLWSAFDGG